MNQSQASEVLSVEGSVKTVHCAAVQGEVLVCCYTMPSHEDPGQASAGQLLYEQDAAALLCLVIKIMTMRGST